MAPAGHPDSHPPRIPGPRTTDAAAARRRAPLLALAVVLLVAAALRVWRLDHGLPDLLDEDYPLRRALAMWGWERGRTDWNPHFFIYPSLSFYLHFLVQKVAVTLGTWAGWYHGAADYRLTFDLDPTPMVMTARAFDVACDLLTLLGVARLAGRLRPGTGPFAALLVAVSPVLIVTSRAVYCDTQLTALSVWALERMVAWHERGGRVRFASAVALVGLAAGAKYPGGLLVIPLAIAIVQRRGRQGLWLIPGAWAAAFAVFLLSSPYVALDFATFRRHFGFEASHMAQGHLGHIGGASFGPALRTLAGNLGWLGVIAVVASLALAIARRIPREVFAGASARVLWAFVLPLGITVGAARAPMERYLAPVIAVGAALAVAAAFALATRLGRRGGWAAGLALAGMVVPVAIEGVRVARSGGGSTQAEARLWCESHVGPRDLLMQEGYGAPLLTRDAREDITQSAYFKAARPELQRRYLARATYHAVTVPFTVAGRPTVPVRAVSGEIVEVEVVPSAADLSRVFYDPGLFAGTDYVLTSGAVRGRYEAEPERFATQAEFYRFLDHDAERVAGFYSHDEVVGPEIRIYRLGPALRASLAARAGALSPLWWAESIPMRYRETIDRLTTADSEPSRGALRMPDGRLAPWVLSLSGLYEARVAPFASALARDLGSLGRFDLAERLARANLTALPDDVDSFRMFVICAYRTRPLPRAAAVVESVLIDPRRQAPAARALRESYDSMLASLPRGGRVP